MMDNLQFFFRFANDGNHFHGAVSRQQAFPQTGVADQTREPRENGEVLRDGRCQQQKKQLGRNFINGIKRNALVMAAKNQKRIMDESHECVAGVGQCYAVADARAMKLLAFLKRAEERFPRLWLIAKFRHLIHQFAQDAVAIRALQTQLDRRWREQLAQHDPIRFLHILRRTLAAEWRP